MCDLSTFLHGVVDSSFSFVVIRSMDSLRAELHGSSAETFQDLMQDAKQWLIKPSP